MFDRALPSENSERCVMDAALESGAHDGISKQRARTVDTLAEEEHFVVINNLKRVVAAKLTVGHKT